ncbi:hypothetical protein ZWY2020_006394 [Hordeum vulgare]|nr:hypothetical protein ZWY2020_006394 [Hordeum vulgare]
MREESKEMEGADGVGNEKKALSFLLPPPPPLMMGRGRSGSIGEVRRRRVLCFCISRIRHRKAMARTEQGRVNNIRGSNDLDDDCGSHKDGLADHVSKANATELKEILLHEHGDASYASSQAWKLLLSSYLMFGLRLLLCWPVISSARVG